MIQTYGAILAAGLGTRLRPLTNWTPKPMLPICGRPMLEYGLDILETASPCAVGINAYHRAEAFNYDFESRVFPTTFAFENTLLGTGGGLKHIAAHFPRGRFVSINGDALINCDLAPILERHIESGAIATMVLRRVPKGSAFARVAHDRVGRIYKISEVESPELMPTPLEYSAYTGVQIVEPELLDLVDDEPCDVIRTGYRRALALGHKIRADFVDGVWLDVGTPERYFQANLTVARLASELEGPWRIRQSSPMSSNKSWIHPHTSIAHGAMLGDGVIVNHPAVLGAKASLTNVVTVGTTFVDHEARGLILYEEQGVTRHIEPK